MNTSDIEYMWKVATNDPNHDTNWYDPVVVAFAKLVANHTMANIDPSSFMSYQEGYAAGQAAEREAVFQLFNTDLGFCHDPMGQKALDKMEAAIRARGQA